MSQTSLRLKVWAMLFRWRAEEKRGIPADLVARADEMCDELGPDAAEVAAAAEETKQRDAPVVSAIKRLRALATRGKKKPAGLNEPG